MATSSQIETTGTNGLAAPATRQEENARILLNHYQIKPEFLFHDGSTIADLMEIVQKRLEQVEETPEEL